MPTLSDPSAINRPAVDARRPGPSAAGIERDAQFVELLNGYRRSGGLARSTDLMAMLRQRGAADLSTVARWIVNQEVVHLEWEGESWLPVFQFSAQMHPYAGLRRSIVELAAVIEPWELAHWFAQANVELAGRCPADVLASDDQALWQAARADRYFRDA